MDINETISKLKDSFKDNHIKEEILDKTWLNKNLKSGIDSTGFCFPASAVLYLIFNGESNWIIMYISKRDWRLGGHCYLKNRQTDEIIDITSDQYSGNKIPYDLGRPLKNFHIEIINKAKILANLAGLGDI